MKKKQWRYKLKWITLPEESCQTYQNPWWELRSGLQESGSRISCNYKMFITKIVRCTIVQPSHPFAVPSHSIPSHPIQSHPIPPRPILPSWRAYLKGMSRSIPVLSGRFSMSPEKASISFFFFSSAGTWEKINFVV